MFLTWVEDGTREVATDDTISLCLHFQYLQEHDNANQKSVTDNIYLSTAFLTITVALIT